MPYSVSIPRWPSAVAPPWLPIAGMMTGSPPHSRTKRAVLAQHRHGVGYVAAAAGEHYAHAWLYAFIKPLLAQLRRGRPGHVFDVAFVEVLADLRYFRQLDVFDELF